MSVILVVDDEPRIAHLVRDYLQAAGFQVFTAYDGPTALAQFRHERPDLVILDLNLPDDGNRTTDGLDVTRAIRREAQTPIIMLTARVEETDRIVGLEMGADDYVTKPFSPRELVARVRAVLRRVSSAEAPTSLLHVGALTIDPDKRLAYRNGQHLPLTTTEFSLLDVLARNPGRVYTRMELLDRVQGIAYEAYERTIDVHVKNLRKKIEPDPHHPRYILTVYGTGYRFSEDPDG